MPRLLLIDKKVNLLKLMLVMIWIHGSNMILDVSI